jgi:hypothetical protein
MNKLSRLYEIFAVEREHFARVFPRVAQAVLTVSPRDCSPASRCAWRDFAWALVDEGEVHMSHRVLALPLENQIGLLRHELGHLADAHVAEPWPEQRADDLAEVVTGKRIYYDARDLQTIGPGQYPRPLRLHR